MAEILTVLTYKSASRIVGDGGTQSWVISPRRVRRCSYVVCVRHQQGPYKAEGDEPHKHAFLVGKVSGVVPSSEMKDRFRIEIDEYAIIGGPQVPLKSASPTQYFPSLSSVGIDEAALDWKPISDLPAMDASSTPIGVGTTKETAQDVGESQGVPSMSVLMQAKKLVADGLKVPLSAVEITVRT
jgi:hypothetical protein